MRDLMTITLTLKTLWLFAKPIISIRQTRARIQEFLAREQFHPGYVPSVSKKNSKVLVAPTTAKVLDYRNKHNLGIDASRKCLVLLLCVGSRNYDSFNPIQSNGGRNLPARTLEVYKIFKYKLKPPNQKLIRS